MKTSRTRLGSVLRGLVLFGASAIADRAVNRRSKFRQLVFAKQVWHHHESVAAEVLDQGRANNLVLVHPSPAHFYYARFGMSSTPVTLNSQS